MILPDLSIAERAKQEVASPVELPTLCEIPTTGQWSRSCWETFIVYEEIAHGNTQIAEANTNALRSSDEAYDELLEAAKLQQQLARIREEMLLHERRDRQLDKWYYRSIIAIGLVAIGVTQ